MKSFMVGVERLLVLASIAMSFHQMAQAETPTTPPTSTAPQPTSTQVKPGVEIQGVWIAFGTPVAEVASKLSLTLQKGGAWSNSFTKGKLNYTVEVGVDTQGNIQKVTWRVWTHEGTPADEFYSSGPNQTEQWWGRPTAEKSDGKIEAGHDCGTITKQYKKNDAVLLVTESQCPFGEVHYDLHYELVTPAKQP